jgi:hypothetical protein
MPATTCMLRCSSACNGRLLEWCIISTCHDYGLYPGVVSACRCMAYNLGMAVSLNSPLHMLSWLLRLCCRSKGGDGGEDDE